MKIALTTVRAATNAILDALEARGTCDVTLDEDYYWFVPSPAVYDVTKPIAGATLGQLSDNLDEIARIAAGESQPVGSDLVALGMLMRFIGERTI